MIDTSKKLSVKLAELTRNIRDRAITVMELETENGPVTKLMETFKTALVHDLEKDGFADMYAQTIAYGLLSARVAKSSANTADDLVTAMPVTNPFLKELMENFLEVVGRKGNESNKIGMDFDELGVSEVVDLLDVVNMEAVVRDFGDRNPLEDPVIHFFEGFLQEYDSKIRKDRGVFYTPPPVVSFIVRSVDDFLRKEFGLEYGLADTSTWGEMTKRFDNLEIPDGVTPEKAFVQILDPATGTGTFLVEVIDLIYKTMTEKWRKDGHLELTFTNLWNDYVPKHLLPRLHGYELMMAPYATAHMKIGLKLYETGYNFESDERARVYLTNALEKSHDFSGTLDFAIPALAHEAEEVNQIKRDQRFTVLIGNPPYSSSISEPPWLMNLMDDWKHGINETKSDLNREEWKFLRFAQHVCTSSGSSILGFIINRDFLDGITKRRMREYLGETFALRQIVDLNGDVNGNVSDENVFSIQQGVCIAMLSTTSAKPCQVYKSLVGTQKFKYDFLLRKENIGKKGEEMKPCAPYYRWVPFSDSAAPDLAEHYYRWISINSVFPVRSSGLETQRDAMCVRHTRQELWDTIQEFDRLSSEVARDKFVIGKDGSDWKISNAKADVRASGPNEKYVTPMLYRPFDIRYTYWTGKTKGFMARPRRDLMRHVIGHENLAMIFNRQVIGAEVSHFGVSRIPICKGTFYLGNKGQDYLAPLYLYFDETLELETGYRQPNLSNEFIRTIQEVLNKEPSADEIFHYIYAVFSSPTYRTRYAEFLKIDYPHVPLTSNLVLFGALAELGTELADIHLLESPILENHITIILRYDRFQVEKVSYSDETVWIDKAKTQGFKDVPEEVWNFHFGGYQVCKKWLKDRQAKSGKNPRPGLMLTNEDIEHYQKIIVAISETIRIMSEIDEVIVRHGGWPGAFQTESNSESLETA